MQVGKQATRGPNCSPKHVRFEGGNATKVSTSGAESAGNSDASPSEEGPSGSLKSKRRKKKSVQEKKGEAARKARVDRGRASSSLEALMSALPHPFPALPTGKPPHKQAVPTNLGSRWCGGPSPIEWSFCCARRSSKSCSSSRGTKG
jgi:hypothetical protein